MSCFDEIIKRIPVDRTAASVTSQGTHFNVQDKHLYHVHSYEPLPITTRKLPGELDFTGQIFGRLDVIGRADLPIKTTILNGKLKHKKIRWVVRCVCGAYEHRSSSALRDIGDRPEEQMCSKCKRVEHLKVRHLLTGNEVSA